jgi:Multiubiquitin
MEVHKEPSTSEGKGHELTFHIAVNGVAEEWHKEKMTYEEAVHLAFPHGPHGGDIRYSVTWTKPDGEEGALRPGHSVDVVNKMLFNVRNTDKS